MASSLVAETRPEDVDRHRRGLDVEHPVVVGAHDVEVLDWINGARSFVEFREWLLVVRVNGSFSKFAVLGREVDAAHPAYVAL
jgi:hypothetical protein